MYNIDEQSVKKLVEINNRLNLLEVKGASNISIVYTSMVLMQEVLAEIEKNTKNITIDTKGG
jgi:hypothetical protein